MACRALGMEGWSWKVSPGPWRGARSLNHPGYLPSFLLGTVAWAKRSHDSDSCGLSLGSWTWASQPWSGSKSKKKNATAKEPRKSPRSQDSSSSGVQGGSCSFVADWNEGLNPLVRGSEALPREDAGPCGLARACWPINFLPWCPGPRLISHHTDRWVSNPFQSARPPGTWDRELRPQWRPWGALRSVQGSYPGHSKAKGCEPGFPGCRPEVAREEGRGGPDRSYVHSAVVSRCGWS